MLKYIAIAFGMYMSRLENKTDNGNYHTSAFNLFREKLKTRKREKPKTRKTENAKN
jgi:hypothetical protein